MAISWEEIFSVWQILITSFCLGNCFRLNFSDCGVDSGDSTDLVMIGALRIGVKGYDSIKSFLWPFSSFLHGVEGVYCMFCLLSYFLLRAIVSLRNPVVTHDYGGV